MKTAAVDNIRQVSGVSPLWSVTVTAYEVTTLRAVHKCAYFFIYYENPRTLAIGCTDRVFVILDLDMHKYSW